MFDVETMGVESTAIVLSASIVFFDADTKVESSPELYWKYVNDACFVKFDAKEQAKKYNRTVTQSTLDWWKKQAEIPRNLALKASEEDLSASEGIEKLRNYINSNGGSKQLVWARGSLDQVVIDSLCRNLDVESLFMYNMWRDVRTAIDMISGYNYCGVKNFKQDHHTIKHDPRHDCALDIMMLVYPQEGTSDE